MAQAPTPTPPAGTAAGGMMGGDPMAGAGGAGGDADTDDNVVVTICSDGQGGYTVFAGDEPESGGAGDQDDMSEDDVGAMGAAGAAPAGGAGGGMGGGNGASPQGQPADSIGAALKIALDIMQSAASSSGAPGDADSQFASGFSADKSPTPASGPAQKY
jgi:hypothetical protein